MLVDVHVTTCHRSDVKCRPRPDPRNGRAWNVKEWTPEERLAISQYSFNSIQRFVKTMREFHDVELTLIDDGSDNQNTIDWMNAIKDTDFNIKRFPARGSSAGINDHMADLRYTPDYIIHFEDDHILFNPDKIDFINIINNGPDGVFTLRSGLPFDTDDKGFTGGWGPQDIINKNVRYVVYNKMGNAHHIMKWDLYKRFLPLSGSTGGCECYMNDRLAQINIKNYEPQIHVHAFHSHMWEYEIDNTLLSRWHKTGEGFEFGIKDMHEHFLDKKPVVSDLRKDSLASREVKRYHSGSYAY